MVWRSIKVKDETKEEIDKKASALGIPKSTLIDEAVEEFGDEMFEEEKERDFMELF